MTTAQAHAHDLASRATAATERDEWAAAVARDVLRRADLAVAEAALEPRPSQPRWWHMVWDQLSDVAFAQAVEPTTRRSGWLHDRLLEIARLDADAWLGPDFRARTMPPQGQLETAHVAIGVATALELVPDVLDPAEMVEVKLALHAKALQPIESWLAVRESGGRLNNWYMVMTDGLVATALATGREDALGGLARRLTTIRNLFEIDSYGESLQYWGYAALHMVELHGRLNAAESMIADLGLAQRDLDDLLLEPLSRCLPWVFASMVSLPGDLPHQPLLAVNVGDSARTWRPPAEVLAALASGRVAAAEAAVASTLLERCYPTEPVGTPSTLSTFGFSPSAGWRAVLTGADRVRVTEPPIPPVATTFAAGTTVIRDDGSPATVLAAQTGHPALRTASHRHADAGSFVFAYAGRVLLADPGHCTYRLAAYGTATSPQAHSTWTFTTGDGEQLEQRLVESIGGWRQPGPVPEMRHTELGVLRVVGADLADAYGHPVRYARRTWMTVMPHVVLVLDEIQADEPVAVTTRFVTNNVGDALDTNVATPSRLVLRRDGVASKLLRLSSVSDGVDSAAPVATSVTALHDTYDPLPLAQGQGREGTGIVRSFTTSMTASHHEAVYALVADAEPRIRGWHVDLHSSAVVVSNPDGATARIDLPRYAPPGCDGAITKGAR